jgi:iron complex transport system substrate-binding protein
MRIVSLLPSATEIICAIGLEDQLVGVTHECDYPEAIRELPKVTRTLIPVDASSRRIDELVRERLQTAGALYSLDLPMLQRLRPDLIVTQALCDVCAVAEDEVQEAACSLPGSVRVVNLEPTNLREVFGSMMQVGEATGKVSQARDAVAVLEKRVKAVAQRSSHVVQPPRVMLLEWLDPPFTSGHWNPELVDLAGGHEILGAAGERSRTSSWGEIARADPEVMVVACCGFDVERTLAELPAACDRDEWRSLTCVRSKRVYVADGAAYFSRPGPRLVDSLEILAHAIHPELHPLATDAQPLICIF